MMEQNFNFLIMLLYNFSISKKIIAFADAVSTFSQIHELDKLAKECAENMHEFMLMQDWKILEIEAQIKGLKEVHKAKPFWKQLLDGKSEIEKFEKLVLDIKLQRPQMKKTIQELQNMIDLTPDTIEEAKAMLDELTLAKKEFQLEKKRISSHKSDVLAAVQAKNASINSRFFFSNPKLRNYQRGTLRQKKNNMLSPIKNALLQIDDEMMQIDRQIIRFKRICASK